MPGSGDMDFEQRPLLCIPPSYPQDWGLKGARAYFSQVLHAVWGMGQAVTQAQTWRKPLRACFEFASLILPFAQRVQGMLSPAAHAAQASLASGGLRRAKLTPHSRPANSANTSGCLVLISAG